MSLECVFQIVYWASLVHRVGCPEKPSLYLLSFLQQVIHPAAQLIVVFGQRAWTSKRRSQIWYNEMTYGGLDSKESTCSARDPDSIPGSGRSPGGGDGHPLQYSCLENPMDRRAWWASVPGVTESDATEGLTLSLCAAPTT